MHHLVDVHMIFPDFDADENDPANYDFHYTDEHTMETDAAGTATFYRLGPSIEHGSKKYGTLPPKDFNKWARICEHIIAHLNYGWGGGHHLNVEYWEIWSEPDLDEDDAPTKRCWGGTKAQYFELYEITSKHLKAKFPELKIGGPALAWRTGQWTDDYLDFVKERNCPLDFFSWHCYASDPQKLYDDAVMLREKLDKRGFTDTLSICDEYNYVKDWTENWDYSLETIAGKKGAAYAAAVMAHCYDVLDILMYYDCRPRTLMNGIYNAYLKLQPTYSTFLMYRNLRRLGICVETITDDKDIYAVAAKGENGTAAMISYFTEQNEKGQTKEVTVNYEGVSGNITIYGIGEDCLLKPYPFKTKGGNFTIELAPNTVIFAEVKY